MKRLQIIILSLVMFLALNFKAQAQDIYGKVDSVEISLLTCEPFHEIYSLYGHTGIRIHDLRTGKDVVANWGVFDMHQSWFVLKFIFGITDYWMAIMPTKYFLDEYDYFHCGVKEQVLKLAPEEKLRILKAIDINAQPENLQYRYNFFYDNCTTRARDIIEDNLQRKLVYPQPSPLTHNSFRMEIHQWNEGHPWYRWGNDILLGVKADLSTTRSEQEFLPDSLSMNFERAGLVSTTRWLLPPQYIPAEMSAMERLLSGPYIIVWVTIVILLLSSYTKWGYILKGLLYEVIGIVGLLLVMMIFSQHPAVSLNLQLLVFNPVCLYLGYLTLVKRKGKKASRFYAFCLLLSLPLGVLLQHFAEAVPALALVLLIDLLRQQRSEKE